MLLARAFSIFLALTISTACAAQESRLINSWQPMSNTATSITGSLDITPGRLTIDHKLHLTLGPPQQISGFTLPAPFTTNVTATAYHLDGDSAATLENTNKLCPAHQPVKWMIVWFDGGNLNVVFSAANALPTKGPESADDCGYYSYF